VSSAKHSPPSKAHNNTHDDQWAYCMSSLMSVKNGGQINGFLLHKKGTALQCPPPCLETMLEIIFQKPFTVLSSLCFECVQVIQIRSFD